MAKILGKCVNNNTCTMVLEVFTGKHDGVTGNQSV